MNSNFEAYIQSPEVKASTTTGQKNVTINSSSLSKSIFPESLSYNNSQVGNYKHNEAVKAD